MRRKLPITLALALALPVAAAQADVIDYRGTGLGIWGIQVNYTLAPTFQYGPGGFAGQIRLANLTTGSPEFIGYCLDAAQTLVDPQEMTVRSLSELPDGGNPARAVAGSGERVAWLLNTYQGGGLISTGTEAAALQLAIWEVLYETDALLSVSAGSGVFSLTNSASYAAATTAANAILASLGSNRSDAIWLDTRRGQDFGVASVPEPGTLLLLGFGLIGAGAAVRRQRRV